MHIQKKILEKYKQSAQKVPPREASPSLEAHSPTKESPASSIAGVPLLFTEPLESPRSNTFAYNSSADFIRFTSQSFPRVAIAATSALPLGVFVRPLGPSAVELPLVDLIPPKKQPNERVDIPRCESCRAYVNPFFRFSDNGQKFQCNICQLVQSVPSFYRCELDSSGQREDMEKRLELRCGSVEFLANEDYTSRPPSEPTFFFLIDVGASASRALVPAYALTAIKELLRGARLSGERAVSFGIALFDEQLHLFEARGPGGLLVTVLPQHLRPPHEFPRGRFLHYLEEHNEEDIAAAIDALIEMSAFSRSEPTVQSLQAALQAIIDMLAQQGGKVVLVLGGDGGFPAKAASDEQGRRACFNPNEQGFTQIATDMHKWMVASDVYIFGRGRYKNVASLLEGVRMSGGEPCYYAQATSEELTRFYNELIYNCSRPLSWEAVFRLRVSVGWKKTALGNQFGSIGNDLLRPEQLDEDFSYYYVLEPDERGLSTSARPAPRALFVQSSLLYTTSQRQRRIRVHNFALPLEEDLRGVYQRVDCEAVVAGLVRAALQGFPENKPLGDIPVEFVNAGKRFLVAIGQKAVLEKEVISRISLSLLGALKAPIFLAKNITDFRGNAVDIVTFDRILLNKVSPTIAFKTFCPTLYDLGGLGSSDGDSQLPTLSLSRSAVERARSPLALLDRGVELRLFVLERDWVVEREIFSGDEWCEEAIGESVAGAALRALIERLRAATHRFLFMYTHVEGTAALSPFLVEEKDSCAGFAHSHNSFCDVYLKGVAKTL